MENQDKEKFFEEYARAEFDKMDKEKKGYIDSSAFADFLTAVNVVKHLPPFNDEQLRKIMLSLDPEKSGKISFEAWKKFLKRGKNAAAKNKK